MSDNPEKLDLQSQNPAEVRREELKRILPEVFTDEGKIDFDQLKRTLGEWVDPGKERYGMQWPGKADCLKSVQKPSLGTLLPVPVESVNFDSTENMIIEGDNLEVLKLLQKSYVGKVKMIYIDPPYNTGNDFIYPDNYSENLQTYLEYSEQTDSLGKRFSTNSDTDGRFHSKWMNMIYPRLFLARNLLSDDGLVFISIDDHELDNLKKICDEVFGDENFIGLFVINSSPSAIDYGHIGKMHDYVLFYSKTLSDITTSQLTEENKEFKFSDKLGPFNVYPLYNGNVAFNPKTRPNLYYPFYVNPLNLIEDNFYEISLEEKPDWIKVYPVTSKKEGIQRVWRWGRSKSQGELNKEIVGYKNESGEFRIVQKSRHTGKVIRSLQVDKDISTRRGTGELENIFGSKIFPFPKSKELIRRFISVGIGEDDIVLDFFAGSGTTAHAVLDLNKQDGGNRRFILVQLPEPTNRKDFPTISEITKERVRRVIKKLNQEESGKLDLDSEKKQDRGFKVFKLAPSNFKVWDASQGSKSGKSEERSKLLQSQLHLTKETELEKRSELDFLYEIILKDGFLLSEKVEVLMIAGKKAYCLRDLYYISLESALTSEFFDSLAKRNPNRLVCLESAFGGDDALKSNAVQLFKSKEAKLVTV